VAKECIRSAHNKFEAESNFWRKVERALGFAKEEKNQLAKKLKTSEHEHQRASARLKNTESQAEDQR